MKKFRSLLKKTTESSKHHRYRHAAVIAKGNCIYSTAVNTIGHHAEINAIVRAGSSCKGATLYTMMTRRSDGTVGNGAPCPECMEAISQAKIRKVVVYV